MRNRESLSLTCKEDHEIRHAAVVDIGIGMIEAPPFLAGIGCEVLQHVLMDFLLQVNTCGAIGADNLVRANAGICRNIPVRVRNPNITWNIADGMTSSLDRGANQALR